MFALSIICAWTLDCPENVITPPRTTPRASVKPVAEHPQPALGLAGPELVARLWIDLNSTVSYMCELNTDLNTEPT